MKKALTLLIFSVFIVSAMAQNTTLQPTRRGNFVIGSRIGFSAAKSTIEVETASGTVKGDGGTSSQFNLAPGIGYFFANNFVLGVGMDWVTTSNKTGIDVEDGTSPSQESKNNNLLFGPFARYFIPAGDDKAFFIGTNVSFGNSKNEFTGSNSTTQSINTSLLSIGVGPGFTIFSSDGWALEALAKYNFAKSDSEINIQGLTRNSTSWTNAIDFSVGVQYYFGGFRAASVNN
jgi:outer membrane protein W